MLSEWDTHIKKTCCDSATNLTSKHPKDIPSHSWESSKPGVCVTKTTFKKLFIWLCWVLGAAWGMWDLYGTFSCGMPTLSCGMWDLVPRAGIELGAPALGAQSLHHHGSSRVFWQSMKRILSLSTRGKNAEDQAQGLIIRIVKLQGRLNFQLQQVKYLEISTLVRK